MLILVYYSLNFVILHTGHEGSHATAEYFRRNNYAIVDREFLDQCDWMRCNISERAHLTDIVTRSPRTKFEEILRERNVSMPPYLDDQFWNAKVRSVLVRLSANEDRSYAKFKTSFVDLTGTSLGT